VGGWAGQFSTAMRRGAWSKMDNDNSIMYYLSYFINEIHGMVGLPGNHHGGDARKGSGC
jgi:hypothetical protein